MRCKLFVRQTLEVARISSATGGVINVPCLKGTNTLIVFVPTAMFLLFESPVRDGVRKISMSQMFLVLKKS